MKRLLLPFHLLLLIVLLSQTVACQRPVVDNPGKTGIDYVPMKSALLECALDSRTAVDQSSATHSMIQKLTGRSTVLDCLEEFPAEIALQFSGTQGLNGIAELSLLVDPEVDAQNAEIRILLPEGFSLYRGSLQWSGNLSKGVRLKMDLSIRAEIVGIWRIEAVATSKPLSDYHKIRSAYCYVQVSEKETFVLSAPPENLAKMDSSRLGIDANPEHFVERASGMVSVYGYWVYENLYGISKPARYARVELWDHNDSGDVLLATTSVQSGGYYEFPAINSTGSLDAYVKLFCQSWEYHIVRVVNSDDVVYWSQTDIHYNVTEGNVDMGVWVVGGAQKKCWAVYDDIVDGYFWLLNETGWEKRYEVYARIVSDPAGSYCLGDGMVIHPLDAFFRDTTLHEYGHCVNYEARGGSFPPSSRQDPEHYPDTEADGGWAFREGWAEFFECAVDNNPMMAYGSTSYGSLETTVYADGQFGHGDYGDWDGNVVEGAVAQVFWDIFDGVNPSDHPRWDEIDYGDYVDSMFDKLWGIFLNDDPDNMDSFWTLWSPKDASIWAVFRHARINIPRNIAVVNVTTSHESVVLGMTTSIDVTATNLGDTVESFNLIVNANDSQVASLGNLTLESHASKTFSADWNTTGFSKGDYAVSAQAMTFPHDLNETDDALEGSPVTVLSPGHDVCVSSIIPSMTLNGSKYSLSIQVKARNIGSSSEAFNVTLYANATFIGLQTVNLESSSYIILVFPWDTAGLERGNYSVTACAIPVLGEIDTMDNAFDRWVLVTIAGDVDGNGRVDIFDIVRMAGGYGAKPPSPRYDPSCDIDGDGDIDIFDIVLAAGNYGKRW